MPLKENDRCYLAKTGPKGKGNCSILFYLNTSNIKCRPHPYTGLYRNCPCSSTHVNLPLGRLSANLATYLGRFHSGLFLWFSHGDASWPICIGLSECIWGRVVATALYYRKVFSYLLAGYTIIAFGAAAESWLAASLWYFSLLNIETIIFQYLVSLGIFPIVAWFSLRLQQGLLRPEHDAPW